VGSGGREHALAWRLAAGRGVELPAAPGNPGIARHGACHPVRVDDVEGLLALTHDLAPELVVVGPEAPLVAGLADAIRAAGTPVFGPSAAAARIEGSKTFAKDVMRAAGVSAARELESPRAPCVVKADGLAAGKGVFVCRSDEEVEAALRAVRELGEKVVVEELLEGEEVSVFALCDGRAAVALPAAQDFKRIGDGDTGPNTGGMGSYAPVPGWDPAEVEELIDAVHRPVLRELAARDAPFVGVLFAGLMLTDDGPRVLEFNCRFGDPETQSLVPLLEGDLGGALAAAAAGDLAGVEIDTSGGAAVTIVLAAGSYPERGDTGSPIEGLTDAEEAGALVFHAGTAVQDGRVVTNGGRVLNVTAVGETVAEARERAYEAVRLVSFRGARYRTDIGARAEHVVG
jgi:phosphoribosylamine---glycine ligase